MAVAVQTLRIELGGAGHDFPVLSMLDRRKRSSVRKQWCLVRATELLLFNVQDRSRGRFAAHLAKMSMEGGVLVADRAAVEEGVLKEEELEAVLGCMRPLLDVEARSRCRKASLVPLTVLCSALTEYGRCDATTAILTAVNKMPKKWRMEIESEANAANMEMDLLLEERLQSEECDELADISFAHELLLPELPYDEEEDAKVSNTALSPVPPSVAAELDKYEAHRMEPFNRLREGAPVVTTTVESDKGNALRFLGYLKTQQGQGTPSVKLFAHARVGEWCEQWVRWLKGEHHLKASTCAVYINGVIAMAGFAMTLVQDPDACPMAELLRLRSQAESIAKQERLFAEKSPNWLSWEDAQRARVASVEKYRAAKGHEQKRAALKDVLVMAFHTLQPPDRVGVVRRLRLGVSLYKKEGESTWTVDLSSLRHKTSRFYGPTVHTLPAAIAPWVDEWVKLTEWDMPPEKPYLFSMSTDWERGHSSSSWTSCVKACMLRHAGVACPPKQLRASFCTFLRSHEEGVDEELRESVAKAMKHQVATGGSDNYDKAAHDRLLAKAHAFCAKIAAQFPAPSGAGSSGPAPISIPGEVECERGEEEGGNVAFLAHVQWHAAMYKGAKMTAEAPPIGAISFPVPTDGAAFSIKLTAPATVQSMKLSRLQVVSAAPPAKRTVAPPAGEEEPDVVERTREEATGSPRALEAQARRDAEGRTAVPSQVRPPIPDALAQLGALGWRAGKAEGRGDCSVLSMMAGHEIKDEAQVLHPSADTLKLVQKARSAGVSIVVGTDPIGGVDAKTFRGQEGLCRTPQAAAKEMKAWRSNRHWYADNAHESAAFLFGVSAHLGRPTIVLEQGEGGVLDPCKVYAARGGDGSLRKSKRKPVSVPSLFPIKFAEVLTTLKEDPKACSVLLYDGEVHFDPLLHGAATAVGTDAPPPAAPVAKKPLPGAFVAVHKPTSKAPVGKKLYTVTMAWNEHMQPGCKLIFHVPPIGKTVTTTLTEKPTAGNLTLQLQLPDTVAEDSFAMGECQLVPAASAPAASVAAAASAAAAAGAVMAQPLTEASLPVATAVPVKKRGGADGGGKAAKKAKPPPPPLPEPDFALQGYRVLSPPADVARLPGTLVAHRFSVQDWEPGWCVGTVVKKITGKRWNGQFEVDYGKAFNPPVYVHALLPEQCGAGKNWVLVEKQ